MSVDALPPGDLGSDPAPGPVSSSAPPDNPPGVGRTASVSEADTWIIDAAEVQAVLGEHDHVVPVLGAGVSQAGGLAGSAALAEHLRREFSPAPAIGEFTQPHNPLYVADDIANGDYEIEQAIKKSVADFWKEEVKKAPLTESITRLVHVKSNLIITFNYDDLLERHADAAKVKFNRWDGLHELRPFTELLLKGGPPEKLTILHLHGTVTDYRTIVLGAGSYAGLQNHEMVHFTQALLRQWTMCFLGTKLDEPHVMEGLLSAHKADRVHPLFLIRAEAHDLRSRAAPTLVRHGVQLCELPSHEHMRGVIRYITPDEKEGAVRDESPPDPSSDRTRPSPNPDYVPTVIAEADLERDDQTTDLFAVLSIGRRQVFAPSYGQQFLTEEEVASEHRALILGVPGSGKSELLRYVGGLAPISTHPVLIRLHEVPLGPAEPATRLERWLASGETFQGPLPDPGPALQGVALHLLLDGLDEVPPSEQARVADQVIDLASVFPQHRFTVATRPVDATAAFEGTDWKHLSLVPGTVWQSRYLKHRGLKLQDLLDQLDAGRDLRDLLQVPFFLVRVVEMRDRLAGLDLWGVVRKLVDEALKLQGQKDLLPLGVPMAREWFEDLALGMHLTGQTLIRSSDVEQLTLSSATTKSPQEICEWLVSRMMLQERREGYAFTHRLIGEALAAAALDRRAPSTELLDAIAPVISGRVHGVRSDWRVPLTLLMLRNKPWREAIRDRDDMQWARTVPPRPLKDRRSAAELIWDRYVDWQIWIWNYDLPDLIQDASALARHLRAGGLDDLVERIRQAIHDSNPRTQGNAIRVLSQADLPGVDLRRDLRHVLNTPGEDLAVVRRRAAIAAARLDYHDLLPLIIERVVNPEDDTETQDGSYAAMDLARDDEVAEVALQLARAPGGNAIAVSRVEDRLGPAEFLQFLSRYAVFDDDPLPSQKDLVIDAIDRLTTADEAVIKAVAALSLRWSVTAPELDELLVRDRRAALAGFKEVFEAEEFDWWRGGLPFSWSSADELASVGAPERLVQMLRTDEEWARAAERSADDRLDTIAGEIADEPAEEERGLTLSELLERPRDEWDVIVAHHSQFYAKEIPNLTDEERGDLRNRLREWWPRDPFPDTITWTKRSGTANSWKMDNFAAAWLWFAPALDMDLSPQQWAEVAMSGVLFEQQTDWLRRKATEEAKVLLARLCTSDEGLIWREALRAAPDPLPEELVNAVAARLRTFDAEYDVTEIAERFAEGRHVNALRTLAGVSDQFAALVTPYLARIGERDAIGQLLDELAADLEAGNRPDGEELEWLAGIAEDRSFLPKLFQCLVRAHRARETSTPVRPRRGRSAFVGWGSLSDPVTPLVHAIRQIGGEEAVARYDAVLASEPGSEFLRLQRNAIAEAELAERGLAAGAAVVRGAALPYSPSDGRRGGAASTGGPAGAAPDGP